MSKAEERALEKYPTHKSVFDKYEKQRYAYICGYIQAEQDLALTWEDIKTIFLLVQVEWNPKKTDEEIYKEVLKRFKDLKK